MVGGGVIWAFAATGTGHLEHNSNLQLNGGKYNN